MREAYDYIIVGAGSAGCVLASRLTEDPKIQVLLVESGPDDRNMFIDMPMGIGKLFDVGAIASGLPHKGHLSYYSISPGGNRSPELWMKGRTIGGSSSINGMVYARGMPSDYDRWEALGCSGWNWQTIGRCFRDIENHELGAAEWRGGSGPLRVSMSRPNALGQATIAAAGKSGTPIVADINDVDATSHGGFGPQPCTIWHGERFSAARAFLRPARRRPNLDVVTDTEALGLVFDHLTATGVQLRGPEGVRVIKAREVILSTGAIHSPKLLQLAGIGPAGLLKNHGIEVRVDAPHVGKNLQEHRTVIIGYRLKHGGRNHQLRGLGLALSALSYGIARRGALTTCIWEVGGLVKTLPNLPEPDCQIGVGLFSRGREGIPKTPGMTIYGYVLRPKSRGELAIASTDPARPPNITANFMSDPYDRIHTVSLYRYMRNLTRQPSLSPFIAAEDTPDPAAETDDDLLEMSYKTAACANHITGTCRMGSDEGAVVDTNLRVRGVNGLRIVDTSVMPTLVSGNTNGPVMALAWHAAERIKATR